jgi:hypothetical protein
MHLAKFSRAWYVLAEAPGPPALADSELVFELDPHAARASAAAKTDRQERTCL